MKKQLSAAVATLAVASTLTIGPAADAGPRHFRSCVAMHRVYPHGVGRYGAHDKTSGKPVTNFRRNNRLYRANNGPRNRATGEYDLDRDNDKIACEAH